MAIECTAMILKMNKLVLGKDFFLSTPLVKSNIITHEIDYLMSAAMKDKSFNDFFKFRNFLNPWLTKQMHIKFFENQL